MATQEFTRMIAVFDLAASGVRLGAGRLGTRGTAGVESECRSGLQFAGAVSVSRWLESWS